MALFCNFSHGSVARPLTTSGYRTVLESGISVGEHSFEPQSTAKPWTESAIPDAENAVDVVDASAALENGYSKRACLVALWLSTIIGVVCIIAGLAGRRQDRSTYQSGVFKALMPLGLNLLVAVCTESLGYIHSRTQQWALWREHRLEFNSNIRLFTFTQRSWANGVTLSTIYLLALAMSYTATSAIILSSDSDGEDGKVQLSFSRAGPTSLGVALLIQVLICVVGLQATSILTWSSHPLINAAVVCKQASMVDNWHTLQTSHHYRVLEAPSSKACSTRRPSAFKFHGSVRTMLVVLLITLFILIIWMSIVLWNALTTGSGSSWSLLPHRGDGSLFDSPWVLLYFFKQISGPETRVFAQMVLALVIQLSVTVGLHISELAVLLSRDEDVWRAAGTSAGTNLRVSSLSMVFGSGKSVSLLFLKPVIHWMYGLAMYITYSGLVMMAPQLVYLTVLWTLLIGFVVFVSLKEPRGSQPVTYGHLQTLSTLIRDGKSDANGRFFWKQTPNPDIMGLEM